MTAAETEAVLAYFMAVFDKPLDETVQGLWRDKLGDLSFRPTCDAIDRFAADGGYPPNPLQIRRAVLEAHTPSALAAWEQVIAEVERVGNYDKPSFADEAIAQAVRAIGWETICLSDPYWMLEKFQRVYEAARSDERGVRITQRELEHAGVSELAGGIGVDPDDV